MEKWIFPKRFQGEKNEKSIWTKLHLALNRPLQTIYDRCQRLFLGPLYKKVRQGPIHQISDLYSIRLISCAVITLPLLQLQGHWSKEDVSRLLDLHNAYGPKWRVIGEELQRLDRDCLTKFIKLTHNTRGILNAMCKSSSDIWGVECVGLPLHYYFCFWENQERKIRNIWQK